MNRRDFLKLSLASGAALTVPALAKEVPVAEVVTEKYGKSPAVEALKDVCAVNIVDRRIFERPDMIAHQIVYEADIGGKHFLFSEIMDEVPEDLSFYDNIAMKAFQRQARR